MAETQVKTGTMSLEEFLRLKSQKTSGRGRKPSAESRRVQSMNVGDIEVFPTNETAEDSSEVKKMVARLRSAIYAVNGKIEVVVYTDNKTVNIAVHRTA